jgi:hypothetical protein
MVDSGSENAAPSRRLLVLGLLAVLVFAGCGSGGGSGGGSSNDNANSVTNTASVSASTAEQKFAPQVIRDGDIQAAPKGSPERAFLAWWQAFQFQDAATVEQLTSKATLKAVGSKPLAKLVQVRGPGTPGIKILSISKHGNTASVRVAMLTFEQDKQGRPIDKVATSTPGTFEMKNESGSWTFASTDYLKNLILNT